MHPWLLPNLYFPLISHREKSFLVSKASLIFASLASFSFLHYCWAKADFRTSALCTRSLRRISVAMITLCVCKVTGFVCLTTSEKQTARRRRIMVNNVYIFEWLRIKISRTDLKFRTTLNSIRNSTTGNYPSIHAAFTWIKHFRFLHAPNWEPQKHHGRVHPPTSFRISFTDSLEWSLDLWSF